MTRVAEHLPPQLHDYVTAHSTPEDPLLAALAAETAQRFPSYTGLQIGPEQGLFMTMLARLMGARRAVEVGTFTGYSSLCIARGLADGGLLTCCDISEDWTSVARSYWDKAGLADRVELKLGPAIDTLRALPPEPAFDLAFIDADKPGYIGYWEEIVPRMRRGGVILVDNTFMHLRILEPEPDASAQGIRDFNDHALADQRVELVMLPVGDGLTMAQTR